VNEDVVDGPLNLYLVFDPSADTVMVMPHEAVTPEYECLRPSADRVELLTPHPLMENVAEGAEVATVITIGWITPPAACSIASHQVA
jgi:hypothetical protein